MFDLIFDLFVLTFYQSDAPDSRPSAHFFPRPSRFAEEARVLEAKH